MESLNEILGESQDVTELTDDALAVAEESLLALFDDIRAGKIEDVSTDDTERLRAIASAVQSVRDEASGRILAAEERAKEVAEIEALVRPITEEVVDEAPVAEAVEEEKVPVEVAAVEAEAELVAEAETEVEAEPILAAAPSLADLSALRPSSAAPVVTSPRQDTIRSLVDGSELNVRQFAELLISRREDFGSFSGQGSERIRLGRQSLNMPSDRTLSRNDSTVNNTEKIEAVVAGAMSPSAWNQALVASGGFCAPTETSYTLEQLSGAQRPVRDALPRFVADRGGIRFVTPPNLADVLVDQAGGAVGAWDNATDISPGESIKSTQVVACGETVEALTQAIYRSLQFGNFTSRAFPEYVETWVKNASAAHSRFAETQLLDSIDADSVAVTTTQVLGTTRDLLPYVAQLAAGERNRQRLASDARLRVMLPAWVVQSIQSDIIRQGNIELKVIGESDIRSYFSALNINVSFYEDTRSGAGQQFAAQGAGADLRNFPATVEWFLFHEGAHVFLDGGVLDLGLVRDSTLNETNDYRLFVETFEATAFRGLFSYRVRSAICADGSAAAPVDATSICDAS
jgi:hypothetical protein